ncbi:helicase-related protein [Oceanobacillus neutriphilus]|uniref:DNA helicase n=1 Tax=Oceanobacillus neutriphilus TaxID=531815 RepID=A0ABQ2NV29_9BACI|nr:helicase-related protein [Oceanobacillus neutriphilus]GGP11239.1 DNA helicase [Oceanobacillus neutriphilus]
MVEKVNKDRQKAVRDKYADAISQLLLGPGSERINIDNTKEIISEKPQNRYVTGILYPLQDNHNKKERKEVVQEAQEGFEKEESAEIDNSFLPSSIGMTFYCSTKNKYLDFLFQTAYYEPIKNPYIQSDKKTLDELIRCLELVKTEKTQSLFEIDEKNDRIRYAYFSEDRDNIINELSKELNEINHISNELKFLINKIKNINYGKKNCYERFPYSQSIKVDLQKEGLKKQTIPNDEEQESDVVFNKKLQVTVYSKIQKIEVESHQILAVTLVIKNNSDKHLFQTEISVDKQLGLDFWASEDIKLPSLSKLNHEDAMNLFLYRHKKTYAFGRGVAAEWTEKDSSVSQIKTNYIPRYELLPMSFEIPNLDNRILRADSYINMNREEQIEKLNTFLSAYEEWIEKIEKSISKLDEVFQNYAKENIEKCKTCSERMRKTIAILQKDDKVFEAFNLANEAMLLQRIEKVNNKVDCYEQSNYESVKFVWRPFQLAFVLNSLESILNEESPDRDTIDLIWVSTGGGKTEAYLFAIAAVILYRRMNYSNYEGVSVIMRYTLRLLTAQQFERASQLICALEFLRRKKDNLGETEITIGLWIGEGTQNYLKNAKEVFKSMVEKKYLDEAKKINTFQVLKCPWCHEEHSIVPDKKDFNVKRKWGYAPIDRTSLKYNMKCTNPLCEFNKGLPIYVVDESIYNVRPTLLFGTVDKFAQVPLKESTQKLFGSDNPEKYRRPEVIIQDELHLLSGPLGSIVGLYEAGFDYIFKNGGNGTSPKYIASTATIRNAEDQVQSIFDRKLFQFPPDGIDISDNFFVKEDKSNYGREYMGVMATGKSQVTAEVRLLSAMLQSITELNLTINEEEIFWTVAGYFNSIRELGKASGLIKDDVKEYINQLYRRNNTRKRLIYDNTSVELTSRIQGIEIPEILKKLDVKHDSDGISKSSKKQPTIDTLIATNMLSVGVDIERLNSMFVVGQPKLTSEYIQATSRVGRNSLGLVCTLYNSSRSRDRSHYETFQSYHQSLYKFVESSSVTPFSVPALKKAVAGVLVAMLRNTVEELSGDSSPINILNNEEKIDEAVDYLMCRVKASEDFHQLYREEAKQIIENFVANWLNLAEEADSLEGEENQTNYYLYKTKSEEFLGKLVLKSFDDSSRHLEATRVMGTMRNVEDAAYLRIID